MALEHINFDGVLAFPLGLHRARLLPSSLPPEAPERARSVSFQPANLCLR
jgi:hypothetical protein